MNKNIFFYIKDLLKIAYPIILGNLGFILIGVGDVVLTSNNIADYYNSDVRVNGRPVGTGFGITISDIKDYRKVFELIKKLQEDIYTDTMYPNALRPEENQGYRTKYNGLN